MSHYTQAKQTVAMIDHELFFEALSEAVKAIENCRIDHRSKDTYVYGPRLGMHYTMTKNGHVCEYDEDYTENALAFHHSVERLYKAYDSVRHLRRQGYVGIKVKNDPVKQEVRVIARRV